MELQFRNAEPADLPAIVAIYNSTIPSRLVTADTEPVTVESREKWFYDHSVDRRPLWVVESDSGSMVGWVSFQSFYGRPAYDATVEISIYLHEMFRGRGLGKQVLEHCISQAAKLGIKTLLGFIFAHNQPSIRLFQQLGFEEWAHLPDIAVLDGAQRSLKIFGRKIND